MSRASDGTYTLPVAAKAPLQVISAADFIKQNENVFLNKEGVPLWKFFVGIALVFLMFEMVLLRFKNNK